MKHEKTIFLENCKKELENNRQEINMVSLMNMILIKGGDVQTPVDIDKLEGLLCNICQILDSPIDIPMSDWDKEQRLLLGQEVEKLHKLRR